MLFQSFDWTILSLFASEELMKFEVFEKIALVALKKRHLFEIRVSIIFTSLLF